MSTCCRTLPTARTSWPAPWTRPRSTPPAATAAAFPASAAAPSHPGHAQGDAALRRHLSRLPTEKLNQETGRKAMIILTDGEDEGSETKIQRRHRRGAANQRDHLCHPHRRPGSTGNFRHGLLRLLRRQEDRRGDRRPRHQRGQQRQEACSRLSADRGRAAHPIRGQLYAHQHKLDGTFRHVAVNCGDGMHVQVRKGYYAPTPGQSSGQ